MSKVIAGLLVAGAGSLIATFALSESCSNEILVKITPFLGTVPGLVISWFSRVKMGGVSKLGFRIKEEEI